MCTSVAAGPLGDLADSVRKAGVTQRTDAGAHVPQLSRTALRPNIAVALQPPVALDTPRANSAAVRDMQPRLPDAEEAVARMHTPQGLHWEDASAPVSPNLVKLARNYHHDGLPVVKLWQANRNMVAIGLNPHGVPGVFFTQALGK